MRKLGVEDKGCEVEVENEDVLEIMKFLIWKCFERCSVE